MPSRQTPSPRTIISGRTRAKFDEALAVDAAKSRLAQLNLLSFLMADSTAGRSTVVEERSISGVMRSHV